MKIAKKVNFLMFCTKTINDNYNPITLCSDNPNAFPPYIPLKQKEPCLDYINESYKYFFTPDGSTCFNDTYLMSIEGKTHLVFFNHRDPGSTYMEDEMNLVLSEWNSICDKLDDPNSQDKCCIKIQWTQDIEDFCQYDFDPYSVAAYCVEQYYPKDIDPDCNINCNNSKIVLNQTYEFMGISELEVQNVPKQFFFNMPPYTFEPDPYEEIDGWWNLFAVLMHELGHYFGFGDQYSPDANGDECQYDESIMDDTDFNKTDRTLSEEDKCMYAKLYSCPPEASSVPEFTSDVIDNDLIIKMYPNPTNINKINIEVNSSVDISKVIKYQIFSINGTLAVEGMLNNNDFVKQIDLKNLNSGSYFLKIHYKNRNYVKIFEKID